MVDDHRGDWFFQNQTGAYYLSDAADFCDRVGLRTQSREYLARALARVTEAPAQVLLIEALVNTRTGDPALSLEALDALDATASADAGIEA